MQGEEHWEGPRGLGPRRERVGVMGPKGSGPQRLVKEGRDSQLTLTPKLSFFFPPSYLSYNTVLKTQKLQKVAGKIKGQTLAFLLLGPNYADD